MVDHYEPGNGGVPLKEELSRVEDLLVRFPKLGRDFRDSNGRTPQRSWFFPPHYHRNGNLAKLVGLCADGHGEIELHLHHGKTQPDTSENLTATISKCVDEYAAYGIFGEIKGRKSYAFIHGDSALDNSRGGDFSGVTNEIDVLLKTGCYADFTHPSGPQTGPRLGNRIFYAKGRQGKSKSHATGTQARVGHRGEGLLIVQGPSHPQFAVSGFRGGQSSLWGLRTVGDHVPDIAVTNARVRAWVDAGIGVLGCPDVSFVKVSTHGAAYGESSLGEDTRLILRTLAEEFNDGEKFKTHYMTAREVFNTIRAIEDGRFDSSDPMATRDYVVCRPMYDTSYKVASASIELQSLVARTY